jgi:hypothetical protein
MDVERRSIRPSVLLTVVLLVLLGSLAAWSLFHPQPAPILVNIGHIRQFPPSSVTLLQLPVGFEDPIHLPPRQNTFGDISELSRLQQAIQFLRRTWQRRSEPIVGNVSPVPIYIVNDPQQGVLAIYQRDSQSTCLVPWQEAEEHFIDPCHGSAYTYTGEYVRGPSLRNLDRFDVSINEQGEVMVDVNKLLRGKSVW